MKKIIDKITEYNKIIIIMHIRPDGDCYGSGFGLKQSILDNFPKKEVYVLGEQLESKSHIGITDTLEDKDFKGALVISLDTGTRSRIYDKRFNEGDYLIRIDHHVHVDFFGDIDYVDTSSPATSYIIASLLMKHDLNISKKTAECLYTGIVTDTGRFRFRGVNGDTHRVVAQLVSTGIDQQYLLGKLYERSLNEIQFEGELLNRIQTDGSIIYLKIPRSLITKYNLSDPVVAEFISILEDIKNFPIWVLFYETDSNIRCRIRSKEFQVDKIANKFNGGGHKHASGATCHSWEETDQLIAELKKGY